MRVKSQIFDLAFGIKSSSICMSPWLEDIKIPKSDLVHNLIVRAISCQHTFFEFSLLWV
jgi:hypothetical protein